MSNHNGPNGNSSEWLALVKGRTGQGGMLKTTDKLGKSIIIEWAKGDILSSDLAAFKSSISDMASRIFAPVEVQFLSTHPHAVSEEIFLRACAPLFEKGEEHVDWEKVDETIRSTIKQFYLADLSRFGMEAIKPLLNDVYFFMTLKDQETNQIIGFLMSSITPALSYGNLKLINLGRYPEDINRGLDKILVAALFKIIPELKRIFLYCRPTNAADLKEYQSCGFKPDLNPIQDPNHKVNLNYLTLLEYRTENANSLQEEAEKLHS